MWILSRYPKDSKKFDFLGSMAISISSILRINAYNANDLETNSSARLSVFVVFISGSLFYHVYNAFLTSALTIPAEYKPFQSPEELLQTSYRY